MTALRRDSWAFMAFLGLLAGVPPLSIDMGIPGFPAMQADLSTDAAGAALTMSLFLIGFAIGPLVLGPLADSIGRRPVLILGMAIFALAGLGCALAPTIGAMQAARFVQGIGAGAGGTLPFVIVRDLFSERDARVRMSVITTVLSIAPVIAPVIGAGVLALAGWRAVSVVLAALGAGLLLVALRVFAESRPVRAPVPLGDTAKSYARVLANPVFRANALINGCAFAMMMAYLVGAPALLIDNAGFSAGGFSLVMLFTGAVMMAGSVLSSLLATRGATARRVVGGAQAVAVLASALLFALTLWAPPGPLGLVGLVAASLFGYGLLAPNVMQAALQPMAAMAGTATAALRVIQMLCGALAGTLTGLLDDGTPVAMAFVLVCFALLGAAAVWRSGPDPAPPFPAAPMAAHPEAAPDGRSRRGSPPS